jgi:hypothetical protein
VKYLSDVSMYHIHGASSKVQDKKDEMFLLNKMNELELIHQTNPLYRFILMYTLRLIWNFLVGIVHAKHRNIVIGYIKFLWVKPKLNL